MPRASGTSSGGQPNFYSTSGKEIRFSFIVSSSETCSLTSCIRSLSALTITVRSEWARAWATAVAMSGVVAGAGAALATLLKVTPGAWAPAPENEERAR